jgi:hypothetical protein
MQIEFEKRLATLGLSYSIKKNGLYTIQCKQRDANTITVRLIRSLPIYRHVFGSRNGNDIQAIGRFKFKLPSQGIEPDILAFAFQNTIKNQVEFLFIPSKEFVRRHVKINPDSVSGKSMAVVIWLMEDGWVYNTTNISPEAEWFFLSLGVNGRLADGTVIDFSEYLNSWQRLII